PGAGRGHHAHDRGSRLSRRRRLPSFPAPVRQARKAGGLMRINWKHLAIGLGALPFAVLVATWIGFFNVGASSGHWKVTEWFLHFAMRSAIRTYALAVDTPGQLPRHAIQPAAGHFARGCAICHGAPGEPR